MSQVHSPSDGAEYAIRRYRPRDRAGFLSLYERVWGQARSAAWFDWRFDADPYGDGVEMIVAERAGTLVGAEPLLPVPLAAAGGAVGARQPVDWIVHPDHRRRGLFTRMTEELLSAAADRSALLFNFPSAALRPGLAKFDWTELGAVNTRYRIQRPARVVPDADGPWSRLASTLARAAEPPLNASLRIADRISRHPEPSVERVDGVDVDAVRTIYRDTRPDAIHVPRERPYLAWRFANPRWETATYVARRGRRPVATSVVATERVGGLTIARVVDVQPMRTDPERADAFAATLLALLRDHAAADVIEAPAGPFPGVLRRHGFLSDGAFPFERLATPTTHAVRPLGSTATERLGRDALDAGEWVLALGDRDVE